VSWQPGASVAVARGLPAQLALATLVSCTADPGEPDPGAAGPRAAGLL